ncbi:Hsp20/alpha crystallin family protein [Saccharicrinis sp. GN24d3]|uniref:Hsp20/alpha crystallin family protein n=1 Tax=Saccharicrinis sp. GN24d3 TaxID=3458416 RepID=UPI0040362BF5
MKTIICNSIYPWFNPLFEFSVFEPFIKYENAVTEEVSQTPDAYKIKYSVPGLKKRDLNICVQDKILTVKGAFKKGKSWWNNKENKTIEHHFLKNTRLSVDMDIDKIKAKLKDGVLNIEIPKKEKFISYREIPVSGKSETIKAIDTERNKATSIIKNFKQQIGSLFKKSA